VEDGRFLIDNNLIENSLRPTALGRKNYLFAGSHDAARGQPWYIHWLPHASCITIEPFQWLKNLLEIIPEYEANQLENLLPGNYAKQAY
jgi:transposase